MQSSPPQLLVAQIQNLNLITKRNEAKLCNRANAHTYRRRRRRWPPQIRTSSSFVLSFFPSSSSSSSSVWSDEISVGEAWKSSSNSTAAAAGGGNGLKSKHALSRGDDSREMGFAKGGGCLCVCVCNSAESELQGSHPSCARQQQPLSPKPAM